ncbi:hypothetical protein J2129_001421 [Methanofollis sp. W23]|nr:hypothetical protein [Methanofollis sp. W23]
MKMILTIINLPLSSLQGSTARPDPQGVIVKIYHEHVPKPSEF